MQRKQDGGQRIRGVPSRYRLVDTSSGSSADFSSTLWPSIRETNDKNIHLDHENEKPLETNILINKQTTRNSNKMETICLTKSVSLTSLKAFNNPSSSINGNIPASPQYQAQREQGQKRGIQRGLVHDQTPIISNNSQLITRPASPRSPRSHVKHILQEDIHQLRIFHNRLLQWRFINARSQAVFHSEDHATERLLFNAWIETYKLRTSVAINHLKLQRAKLRTRLFTMLHSHGKRLEEWFRLQKEHSANLDSIINALETSMLAVPLSNGSKGDPQTIYEALQHASFVLGSIDATTYHLLPKTEEQSRLVHELAQIVAREQACIVECIGLLTKFSALEIEERSLRVHLIQMEREEGHHINICI